ncbi:MAG: DUF2238 domain-containing protein [Chloroflexota bacterium]|nr:DUF2238 domain-containing protein [Chloroflexota bacterium]
MHTTPQKRSVVWGILLIAVLVNILGYTLNLYQQFWWYDRFLHFFTPFAITLPLALYLYGPVLTGARDHRLLLILTVASLGIAIGALWELTEWGYDLIAAGNAIKGKWDTMIDLIMDTLGSILAGWVSVRMVQPEARAE